MKIGYIGLGRMGKNMVLRLLEQGIEVVAWNRSPEPREEMGEEAKGLSSGSENLQIVESLDGLVGSLESPRAVWLMVSAGPAIDDVLDQLVEKLAPGDLVIDGGNSLYKDTLRRADKLSQKHIHYMDVGTSGGIEGARHGACIMIGGAKEDYERVLEVFKAATQLNGYAYLGPVGSGHFAKTIHNGIEYGMMEAIGEGAAILKFSPFNYDLREVFRIYNTGSIIESRLVGWTLAELKNDPTLLNISSVIGSGGGSGKTKAEGHWTVELAKEMGIHTPVIEASVEVRNNSDQDKEDSPNGFRNKIVAAMRWQFGRHPVKKN
ncbi:6-phosphogluconate dehydrogenase (decarboxylating) [Candidatus Daviesbacteria bacterium RIFCSPHIGHO2_02_FULL_39_12]|uniref:6-phosphogluconate dehydrogenase (Decarboxylating) n=2 Tax=Candidatus Daviesiibacteriota TaxID=1752718 RepID=A0A1F5JDG9_9BACT|nr:MAG: 6-phosphogluconate dehydrogenase (decarboxylating) [Candidatus Daviesbacteria bacterium RIFCSPHIGHO2_02_FULL_39_12]OGE71599.1 MAG: 6-phosphogluconate dehydrogenase (decarboxylating) [Candidatus Daviesbacteria bacterium RIFCSPLOWO2_02_FULL_38_15]